MQKQQVVRSMVHLSSPSKIWSRFRVLPL